MPARRSSRSSSLQAAPPPTPIPTGRGSRTAAGPILSEYIDRSIQIPQLSLPRQFHRFKPAEIDYKSLRLKENGSVRELLRWSREFGVFQIVQHGIATEELRFALANSDRIFGLTLGCCTSYGDHEKLVWRDDVDRIMAEAAVVIDERNLQIFRQKMEIVASKLGAIAEELAKVMWKGAKRKFQLGESTLSIYRYHRANIIDRTSSQVGEPNQESEPNAFSLHILLESGEVCGQRAEGNLSFGTRVDTIIVTMGKELEEWSDGEFRSAQGNFMFKPFLHSNKPSFSIEQKWSAASVLNNVVGESNKIISVADQILILLSVTLLCQFFAYISS